jgi:hypothetical protein
MNIVGFAVWLQHEFAKNTSDIGPVWVRMRHLTNSWWKVALEITIDHDGTMDTALQEYEEHLPPFEQADDVNGVMFELKPDTRVPGRAHGQAYVHPDPPVPLLFE